MRHTFLRKPLTPDLSPNMQMRDIGFGLAQLLLPWNWSRWINERDPEILADAFRKMFGVKNAYTFDSGRIALYAVLQALQLQPGDEVILQSFTCVVVSDAVIATGATPLYCDIDPTYNIDVEALKLLVGKAKQPKAVIVQHTFGQPAAMQEILAFCKEKGLYVIEDCAHSLGSRIGDQRIGTFGDAAIFSFGRDKVVSSISGGVAITSRADIAERIAAYHASLPYPSRKWIAQRLIYPAVFEKAKWLYYVGPLGKIHIEFSKRFGIVPLVMTPAEKRGKLPKAYRMPGVLARWAHAQMQTLDTRNAHRQTLAAIYATGLEQLISKHAVEPQQTRAGTTTLWLRWSMAFERPQALRAFCKSQGILLGNWYDTPVAPADTDLESVHYTIESCPNAEKLARKIVNLPTSVNTSKKDAQEIVTIIKQFFHTQL